MPSRRCDWPLATARLSYKRELLDRIVGRSNGSGAGRLLSAFGGIAAILAAPTAHLRDVLGDGEELDLLDAVQALRREAAYEILNEVPFDPRDKRIAGALIEMMAPLTHEQLHIFYLGPRNRCRGHDIAKAGSRSSLAASPALLFDKAARRKETALVLAHNHPSGSPEPSKADIRFTRRAIEMRISVQ